MSEPWLVARDIWKSYHTGKRDVEVLRGVSLEIAAGEAIAVTGHSGSGKTTLLNLLGSLDRPERGSILWSGEDILSLGAGRLSRLRNQAIGFVFQFHHLLADFSALENVTLPARIDKAVDTVAEARARQLLARVGLEGREDHRPGELSGGEQQRVAVARALMNGPRLLLADEPAGNLDRERAAHLHDLLFQLRRDESLAVVIVTHDETVARAADRWLHLDQGQLRAHAANRQGA